MTTDSTGRRFLTPMERRELLIAMRPGLVARAIHEERVMRAYSFRARRRKVRA